MPKAGKKVKISDKISVYDKKDGQIKHIYPKNKGPKKAPTYIYR